MKKGLVIVGYSGHAFVCIDAWISAGGKVVAYCEQDMKQKNPYDLDYLGNESIDLIKDRLWFVGIGNSKIRKTIVDRLVEQGADMPSSILHTTAVISPSSKIGSGVLIAAGSVINPLVNIEDGCIVNTSASIDHECLIGAYSHIAPNATLCGNVSVGTHSFVGAGSVIREGVEIGNNVIIGAGAVVVKNVPSNTTVVGNPIRKIK